MTISEALKRWRSAQSISQAEAAAKFAVSLRTYQGWEQARREPSGTMLPSLWQVIAPLLNPQTTLRGSFAELLKQYRRQTRQNRREAAKSLDVSAGAIQDWEQERRVPNGATMARLLSQFEAAAERWNRAQTAPPSAEEAHLIAIFSRKARPYRHRKRVFADPQEGKEATLKWLEHARRELEKTRGKWDFRRSCDYLQESIVRMERDLARYERRIAEALAKANRTNQRLSSRKPRRKSPVLPAAPL